MHLISRALFVSAALFALPGAAQAARTPDLAVQIISPGPVLVDSPAHYRVLIENVGRRRADNVRVQLRFPLTATSPTAFVLGTVSGMDARCFDDGTVYECVLGRLRRGAATTIEFDFSSPYSAVAGEVSAEASTTNEGDWSNNAAATPVELLYFAQALSAPATATVSHCTGQGLISYYDCIVSPTSTHSHLVTLGANGTISFPNYPTTHGGRWSQASPEDLFMEYTGYGRVVMTFQGKAIGNDCFDGIATFASPYNAAYRVCF